MKTTLIVGLGNPGSEYAKTYHNAGSMFIASILGNIQSETLKKNHLQYNKGVWKNREVIFANLADSDQFMNGAGSYVVALLKHLHLRPKELIVVHDDSDILIGKYKHSFGVRSAGHKGVESIIQSLGTNEFHRLRIGIRKKPGKALEFVLKKMSKSDLETMNSIFQNMQIYIEHKLLSL